MEIDFNNLEIQTNNVNSPGFLKTGNVLVLEDYSSSAILHSHPQMMAERQQSAWTSKEGYNTHFYSLTHQGPLVIGHSPQGHHTALPGANSNTDLVRLQGVMRRAGDPPSSHWWVGRGQGWVQVSIRCHRNCTELGIWVERCRKKKEKRRRWVPHYPVTVLMSKLFSMLAAANRILAV